MICQTHSKKRFAICQKCKSELCLSCILEKHQNHLDDIVFINNILLLIHNTNDFMIQFQKYLNKEHNANLNILIYLNEQLELYQTQLQEILQNNKIECSLDFLLYVIEKHFQRNLYSSITISNDLDQEQKFKLKAEIEPYFKKDKILYLYTKTYDMYYLLLNYGNNKNALNKYKQILEQLMEKTILQFDFLVSKIKRNYLQTKIEYDEFFNIQLGRNYYFISEFDRCIKYMDQFHQNDEAQIYKGLSLMFLSKLDEANNHFENLKLNQKYYYQTLYIKGYILSLQKKFQKCIPIYEELYEKFQYSLFFRQLCYFLFMLKRMDELKIKSDKAIQQEPNNYYALFYKAMSIRNNDFDQYESIVNKLIEINQQIISGQVLRVFLLLSKEKQKEAEEVYNFILQRFSNQTLFEQFVTFFKSVYLFTENKFHDAYVLFQQLPDDFFEEKLAKLLFEILFLLRYQNLPVASRKLLQASEDSASFYLIVDQFCQLIDGCGLTQQAFYFTEGFQDEIPQGNEGFYHFLRGKLLFDQGQKLKDNKMIEEALIYLNENSNDNSSLPYRYYYSGQALMYLSRLDQAANQFKKAKQIEKDFKVQPIDLYINLFICELMQGHIDKAQQYMNQNPIKNNLALVPFYNFMYGMIYFIKGDIKKSLDKLQKLKDFPLIDFIISWIYKEQNKIQESKQLIKQLDENHPQFKSFCEKYTFITSGPFSTFMKDNQEKFNNFDNKLYFSLKTVAFFMETQGIILQRAFCFQVIKNTAIQALINDLQRSQKQKQKSSLQNYPFL